MTHQHPAGFRSALRRTAAALTLAVASAAALSAQKFEYEGLTYSVNSDDSAPTCTVAGNYVSGKVTIPSVAYYEGTAYTVTSIEEGAFMWRTGITEVELPPTLTSIGNYAFDMCENLTHVTAIPASVSFIGLGVFAGCKNLAEIRVEKGNSAYLDVDGVLFDAHSVVQFPGGKSGPFAIPERTDLGEVTAIGKRAFYWCKSMTEVTIPSTVTTIPSENECPFVECDLLTDINVDKGNPAFYSVDGVLFDREGLLAYPSGRVGSYIVPEKTDIGGDVTTIHSYAFQWCHNLTELTLPASLTNLEPDAIYGGLNISAINVAEGNTVFQSVDGVLYDCNGVLQCPTGKAGHYVIPSRTDICGPVTTLQDFAFNSCSKLTEVTIPSTVTTIGACVFYWTGITKLNVFAVNPPSVAFDYPPLGIEDTPDHVVRVPYGTLEAYSKAEGWSGLNLVEMTQEESALDEVRSADSEAVDVYTLQGVCVKRGARRADIDALPAGLYLVGGQKRLVR